MSMMKKNYFNAFMLVVLITTIISCSDNAGYKKTDSGLKYKFYTTNKDAKKPSIGDILTVKMLYKLKLEDKDSLIYNSEDNNVETKIKLDSSLYSGDINEGLALMGEGDSASFIINADSFFTKNVGLQEVPELFKKGAKLIFDVKLVSFQTKADYEIEQKEKIEKLKVMMEERKTKEPTEILAYVKEKNISAKPSKTGLYYIETIKGTGAKAAAGKKVKVNYTGKLLDGTVFDTSEGKEPIEFTVGAQQLIPGWEEGILKMNKGGKATLLIPSELAYGANGAGNSILPYTPLLFDLELIDVQ